jgi:hypothetical protein
MLKKMTVPAMALGVVAAMLVPGTASAAWKHHNTAIQQDVQIGLTGTAGFQSESGGISCQVPSQVKFLAGQTTALRETVVPHPTSATTNCTTSGGLAQCEVEQVQPTNLNWTLHTTGTAQAPTIQETFGDIHTEIRKKNIFCLFFHITITGGSKSWQPTPTSGNTVTTFHVTGNTQAHTYTNTEQQQGATPAVTFNETLDVESPNSGTYSI